MDSVTQVVLGACAAGVAVPAGQRRKALAVGAALGTLPDLDVFIDFGGAVENFTYHRGFSHSIFVLLPLALLIWLLLRRWWRPVQTAPGRWLAAITLALVTHPLLDAHTSYGTQLWWPLSTPPVSWSTIFIIDPLYTLPLLLATLLALLRPASRWSGHALAGGLLLSSVYLGWSWLAKDLAEQNARLALHQSGLADAPIFSVPAPFNTVLWRVVVMTDNGYLEGFDSLLVDEGAMRFDAYPSDTEALRQAGDIWAVNRLQWFANGFVKASRWDDQLVISDLRMGLEPHYVFSHVVARHGNPHWQPVTTRLIRPSYDTTVLLRQVWQRIWHAN
jgi:inner membrane protein